jgi:predicted RNase H-like HicB family nuclease
MPEHRYAVIVYWSERDAAYIAEAPELPGSAADGASYHEAVTHLEVVMDEWIEIASELGRTVPPRSPWRSRPGAAG